MIFFSAFVCWLIAEVYELKIEYNGPMVVNLIIMQVFVMFVCHIDIDVFGECVDDVDVTKWVLYKLYIVRLFVSFFQAINSIFSMQKKKTEIQM